MQAHKAFFLKKMIFFSLNKKYIKFFCVFSVFIISQIYFLCFLALQSLNFLCVFFIFIITMVASVKIYRHFRKMREHFIRNLIMKCLIICIVPSFFYFSSR